METHASFAYGLWSLVLLMFAFSFSRPRTRALTLAAALAAAPVAAQPADDAAGFRKEVAGFTLYLAVMPAPVLAGPAPSVEPGASPFRRAPAARDTHHVMVSLFESTSGRRVTDARVEARVAALGFSGETKPLEPASVGGAQLYVGTFPMLGRGPFRVDVEFRLRQSARPQRARFYFTHPSFAPPRKKNGPGEG